MLIDLILAVLLVLAALRGYRQGLIIGLFSLVAVIIGLAAAMKLSTLVAGWIGKSVNISEEWLPLISFIVVFLVIVLLIRLGAKAIERTVEFALLGWVNKLGGMILYLAIYALVFSVVLFYTEQMQLLRPNTISESQTYPYIQPWGPRVINGLGAMIPFFKDMFGELEKFFERISEKLSLL